MKGRSDSPPHPNNSLHHLARQRWPQLPEIDNMRAGYDKRVSGRSGIKWEECQPAATFANNLHLLVFIASNGAEVATWNIRRRRHSASGLQLRAILRPNDEHADDLDRNYRAVENHEMR